MISLLAGMQQLFTRGSPARDNGELKRQGNALLAEGKLAEALACYEQAVTLCPEDALAHINLGYTLAETREWERAERVLRTAVRLDATQADAWFLLGQVLNARSAWADAEASLRQALALQPEFPFARRELAQALAPMGRHAEALAELDAALPAFDQDASLLHLRGNLQFALKRFEEAAQSYEGAAALHPDFVEAIANRGVALHKLGRLGEAQPLLRRALELRPLYPAAVYNLGRLLLDECRCEEVVALCDAALEVHPGEADIHLNRADALLLLGRLEEGWPEYEWRWSAPGLGHSLQRPKVRAPAWTGRERIAGATILVLHEQGLGDSIQFMRYARVLAAAGARVLVQLPPALEPLFEHDTAFSLVREGQALPPLDFHITLPSLPMALRTSLQTIPQDLPYLRGDARRRAEWESELGPRRGPRVGLVWSGNAAHNNDLKRSIPLAALMAQAPPGVQWVSLQKEVRESDRAALQASGLFDAAPGLASFADTAALVDAMDLVVSVDTSVAHLAGALGRPLALLLPFRPDWRWMLQRDDSPWYPGARLYRQDGRRDWAPVIERVMADLPDLAAAQAPR